MNALLAFAKDHVWPHPGNGHHPRLLHHRHLFSMGAMLLTMKAATIVAPILLPGAVTQASVITPQNIVMLTNVTRHDTHIPELLENTTLDQAAQQKADDMVANNYFGHESPSGQTAMDLILASGYPARIAAENLAVRYTEAEDVEAGWLLSPTHRENIVNPEYTDIGVGVSKGPYKGTPAMFVVQLFGRPLDTSSVSTTTIASSTVAAVVVNAPQTPTWKQQIASALQNMSETADAIVILFVASILLLTLSIKFHERHLATITHALAVIGIAIILRMV